MNRNKKCGNGVAIIWIVLCIPVLITLAAFVLNIAISYTATEQAKSYTRLLSLLSLEQFHDIFNDKSAPSDLATIKVSLDAVKSRINTLSKTNKLTAFKKKEFENLGYPWEKTDQVGGKIIPGIYYKMDPAIPVATRADETRTTLSGPCASKGGYPCFIPFEKPEELANVDPESKMLAYNSVNAFKVEGNYLESLSMYIFGTFLGDQKKVLKSCSIASALAKNIFFIVDISGSSVSETHIRRTVDSQVRSYRHGRETLNDLRGRGSYFAYPADVVNEIKKCPLQPGAVVPPNKAARPDDFHYFSSISPECDWYFLKKYGPLDDSWPPTTIWGGKEVTRAKASSFYLRPTLVNHYAGDFVDLAKITGPLLSNSYLHPSSGVFTAGSDLIGKSYYLDSYIINRPIAGDVNHGPEPLWSILDSLYTGVSQLQKRKIASDKAGYIFFDNTLAWFRSVNLTSNFRYLLGIACPDNKCAEETSIVSSPHTRQKVISSYGLFPTENSYTDITIALKQSALQIISNRNSSASVATVDSVIYIGDFMPNCTAKKYLSDYSDSCAASGTCNERECKDDYPHYKGAINEIWDLVSTVFIPNDISLNIILLGKHVGPHTIDIPGPDGTCLTDDEAREADPPLKFVLGGKEDGSMPVDPQVWASLYDVDFDLAGTDTPFYQAGADAYAIARATGGMFKPVLKPNNECIQNVKEPELKEKIITDYSKCVAGRRRLCAEPGLSQKDQLNDYITKLVGEDNPYKIVSTDCDL